MSFLQHARMLGWVVLCCWCNGSCRKDAVQLPVFRAVELPTTHDLRGVFFVDTSRGYVVGGDTWQSGFILSTTDGGQTWKTDTLVGKILEDIYFDPEGRGYACGLDGILLTLPPGQQHWQMLRQDYLWYRGVSFRHNNVGLLVGGEGWKNGSITRLSTHYLQDTVFRFPNELDAVCFSDDKTAHAVGMGQILRSEDGGKSWRRTRNVPNDFYRSIQFLNDSTGYVCGYSGTILRTHNGGKSWQIACDINSLASGKALLRTIRFADTKTGFVAGDNGCLLISRDSGNTWQSIEHGAPPVHFTKIFVGQNWAWLIGEQGKCYYFEF